MLRFCWVMLRRATTIGGLFTDLVAPVAVSTDDRGYDAVLLLKQHEQTCKERIERDVIHIIVCNHCNGNRTHDSCAWVLHVLLLFTLLLTCCSTEGPG